MGAFAERLVLDNESLGHIIYNEHLVRYQLAAKLVSGKKVLDIASGSGYGANLLQIAGGEVTGVDIDEASIQNAQKLFPQVKFLVGSAEKLDQADQEFDLITSFETIEHLEYPEKYLAELARVLETNGLALISTPNREVFQAKNPYHIKEYNRQEFSDLLKGYFKEVIILEQRNGLATYITASNNLAFNTNTKVEARVEMELTTTSTPLYFIAVCSQSEITENFFSKNFVSINEKALTNLYNNPGLKIINKIYIFITKIPGVRKFLSKVKK